MSAETFPQDVLGAPGATSATPQPGQAVQAVPGAGLNVPLWILGSSLFGAQLAAALGLPYAFASHFAPADLMPALAIYRDEFRAVGAARQPYAMVGVERDRRGQRRRGEAAVHFAAAGVHESLSRHARPALAADRRYRALLGAAEKAQAQRMLECSFVGSPTPCAPASAASSRTGCGRGDRRGRDLRPRRAAAFVRAARRGVRFGSALARAKGKERGRRWRTISARA